MKPTFSASMSQIRHIRQITATCNNNKRSNNTNNNNNNQRYSFINTSETNEDNLRNTDANIPISNATTLPCKPPTATTRK